MAKAKKFESSEDIKKIEKGERNNFIRGLAEAERGRKPTKKEIRETREFIDSMDYK